MDKEIRNPKYDSSACEGPRVKDFGFALEQLRTGKKLFRRAWNGKGMYLAIQWPDDVSKMSLPYIYMRTADNQLVPWLASQTDLLSADWEVFK